MSKKIEIIGPEMDEDRQAAYQRKRERLLEGLAQGLKKTRLNWAPTPGSDDIAAESRAHVAHATAGLKRVLARAAAAEGPPAAAEDSDDA